MLRGAGVGGRAGVKRHRADASGADREGAEVVAIVRGPGDPDRKALAGPRQLGRELLRHDDAVAAIAGVDMRVDRPAIDGQRDFWNRARLGKARPIVGIGQLALADEQPRTGIVVGHDIAGEGLRPEDSVGLAEARFARRPLGRHPVRDC